MATRLRERAITSLYDPRGVLNKFLYGEAPPRGPTPYPFIYHFSGKRYPFRIPSIDKWYSFHTPCLELASLITAVNALSFK